MNTYIATFYTHYGAMKFHSVCKKQSIPGKLMPVPRTLSASCGTCVQFQHASPQFAWSSEDLEHCYQVDMEGNYLPLHS